MITLRLVSNANANPSSFSIIYEVLEGYIQKFGQAKLNCPHNLWYTRNGSWERL